MAASDEIHKRVLNAFIESYQDDLEADGVRPLRDYLEAHPRHEDLIAREYLRLRSEAHGGEPTATPATAAGLGDAPGEPAAMIGPYRLRRELGRGGQAVVWLAEDSRLGRNVALKLLHGIGPAPEKALARFRREAAVTAKLDHPGICTILEIGFDGVPWIAMRYVEGRSLAAILSDARAAHQPLDTWVAESLVTAPGRPAVEEGDAPGPRTPPTSSGVRHSREELTLVLDLVEKVARALHAAHELGVVHRDIKPANIMVTPEREPVVLDFGIAAVEEDDAARLTLSGDLIGTPAYMAPEQIDPQGRVIDRRADIHALGVTLFEALAGVRPFSGPSHGELRRAILEESPPRLNRLNPAVSRDLETVVRMSLAKDPRHRYSTALGLAEDLERVRKREPVRARRVSAPRRAWMWSLRHPAAAGLLLALVLGLPLLVGLLVYVAANQDDLERQRAAARMRRIDDLVTQGLHDLHFGDAERALDWLEQAYEIDPASPSAAVGLAWGQFSTQRREEARRTIRAADSDLPAVRRLEHLIVEGLEDRAGKLVAFEGFGRPRTALEGFVTGRAWIAVGFAREAAGFAAGGRKAFDRAAAAYRGAIASSYEPRLLYHAGLAHALYLTRDHAHYLDAEVTTSSEDREERRALAWNLTERWPDLQMAWFWACRLMANVDPQQALDFIERAISLPGRSDPLALRGERAQVLALAGRIDEALAIRADLVQEASLAPARRAELFALLSRMEETNGDLERALAHILEARNLVPEDFRTHANLLRLYAKLGRVDEAAGVVDTLIDLRPDVAEWHLWRSTVCLERNLAPEAESAIREALRLEGGAGIGFLLPADRARAHLILGQLMNQRGELEEAIGHMQRSLAIVADDPGRWNELGHCLHRAGRDFEGLQAHSRALDLAPEDPVQLELTAQSAVRAGATAHALECLRRAREQRLDATTRERIDRAFAETLGLHARGALARGRISEALEAAEERALLSGTTAAWADAARLVLEAPRRTSRDDLHTAIECAREAVNLATGDALPPLLDLLARIQFAAKDLRGAVETQTRLVRILDGRSAAGLDSRAMQERLKTWRGS